MPSKMWDEITNPFPNFKGSTEEVWDWMSNLSHFVTGIITQSILVKGTLGFIVHPKIHARV